MIDLNSLKGTGQLVFRDTPTGCPGDRTKLMMVAGVVRVPVDFPIPGEHQVSIGVATGTPSNAECFVLALDTVEDRTEVLMGTTLDGMIKTQIWRA